MQFIKDLSISKKITGIILILITLMVITSAFGITKMRAIGAEFQSVQKEDIPLMELVSDVTVKQLEKAILLEKAMRIAGLTDAEQTIPEIHHKITELAQQIEEEIQQAATILSKSRSHALNAEQQKMLDILAQQLTSINNEHRQFESEVEQIMGALERGQDEASTTVLTLEQSEKKFNAHLEEMLLGVNKMTEQAIEQVHHDEEVGLQGMIWISAISALVGILSGILISRAITRPLALALQAAQRIAAGDLTAKIQVTSADETGQLLTAMQAMNERLQNMVSQIAASTEQLSGAAQEVATVTSATANSVDSQTDQLNATAVAMDEMSTSVRDVANSANEASASTDRAKEEAQQGRNIVEQVNTSIKELASEIEHAKLSIGRLDKETANVDGILATITSVSEQTNLLALNAAIEAARAGEQGRGFAVVADEVRSLASRTQESVTTIQEMISSLKREARISVEAMDAGYTKANETVNLSQKAETSLMEIARAVDMIAAMNLQIASAAGQQSIVADQVSESVTAIQQMNESTNGTAQTGAQQVATATEELSQLSENLKTLIGQFKVA